MRKLLFLIFLFCGFLLPAAAQQKTITGSVKGAEDNLPALGATVLVKGTTTGTLTDVDGKYQISVPQGVILEFRFVGMKTKEVTIGASSVYVASYPYNDPKLLFPIPARELEANPNLKPQQNPGY